MSRSDAQVELEWAIAALEGALRQLWNAENALNDSRLRLARAIDAIAAPAPSGSAPTGTPKPAEME